MLRQITRLGHSGRRPPPQRTLLINRAYICNANSCTNHVNNDQTKLQPLSSSESKSSPSENDVCLSTTSALVACTTASLLATFVAPSNISHGSEINLTQSNQYKSGKGSQSSVLNKHFPDGSLWNTHHNAFHYRKFTTLCEPPNLPSNKQPQRDYHSFYKSYYNDKNKSDKDDDSDKNSKEKSTESDSSFFDMAQQWAVENLSKTSSSETDISAKNSISATESAASGSSTKKESIFDGPEAFLKEYGLLKGVISPPNNEQQQNESIDDMQDEKFQTHLDNAKDRMQSFLGKFQGEYKQSTPNSSESPNNSNVSDLHKNEEQNKTSAFENFFSLAKNASSIFSSSNKNDSPPDIHELIQQAQTIASQVPAQLSHSTASTSPSTYTSFSSLDSLSSTGFLSQVLYFQKNAQAIQTAFESSLESKALASLTKNKSDLFQSLSPTTLHYYLEYEDSIKTPSWKRRVHRFQPSVEVSKVEELNEALILSELSYADSVEEVREGLNWLHRNTSNDGNSSSSSTSKPHWELLFCDTKSQPNKPSHFLAIQKNASQYDDALRVLMVVRGTKSMSDLITDAMMEATDYEYSLPDGVYVDFANEEDDGSGGNVAGTRNAIRGKAHSGMVQSGKYLVQRHQKLLSTLLKLSNKRKLEITLIGHSLGAGAATMAAMEWNSQSFTNDDDDNRKDEKIQVSAHVVGFGCPALLSQSLSQVTRDYVTTVIADADFIPRMSGATLVNLLLDLRKFNYRNQAERDVEQALKDLQNRFTGSSSGKPKNKSVFNISDDDIQKVMGYVNRGLETIAPSSTSQQNEISGQNNMDEDVKEATEERMEPILFPPGTCIHFYRDGSGIDGTYVPCNFFNEVCCFENARR